MKSGWSYTVRVSGQVITEGFVAVVVTTSSMLMEVKTITEALRYLQSKQYRRAIRVTDSMGTLQKRYQRKPLCRLGSSSSPQANLNDSLGFSVRATLAFKITSEQTVLQALHIDNNLTNCHPMRNRTTRGKQTLLGIENIAIFVRNI